MFFDNESSVGAMVTAVRSDAQDDGKKRAEDTAVTVTGASQVYATPMERLGQPSFSRLRKPGRGNRKIRFVKRETRSEIERERWQPVGLLCSPNAREFHLCLAGTHRG